MWPGRMWSGTMWSGGTWDGRMWSGRTWSRGTWTGRMWSGGTWTARTWTGRMVRRHLVRPDVVSREMELAHRPTIRRPRPPRRTFGAAVASDRPVGLGYLPGVKLWGARS
jgi:hypothetical protein